MSVSAQSPLLRANVVNVEAVQEGNTRAAHIRATGLSVQRVSRPVWVRSNCYAKTNLYIKNSRGLVKVNGQLHTFWYVVGLREVFFVCCILGILAFLHISVAIIFLIIGLIWLPVFTQHLFVIGSTMIYVMRQPVVSNTKQTRDNMILEVKIREAEGVIVETEIEVPEANMKAELTLGNQAVSQETIRIQRFNERGYCNMKKSVVLSAFMFLLTLEMIIWAAMWLSINAGHISSEN